MSLEVSLEPILSQLIAGGSVVGLSALGRYLYKTSVQVHENQDMIMKTRRDLQDLEEKI